MNPNDMSETKEFHCGCYACGTGNASGLGLRFEIDADGVAHATWHPTPAFESYPDRVHGGVIAVLLDASMVHALFAKGVAGVTAEMTIRYLQAVSTGAPVAVSGRLESTRHGVYFCQAEIRQDEIIVVHASAKFMAMRPTLT